MSDPLGRAIRFIARYPGGILARAKLSPNQITILGLFVNCVVAYLISPATVNYLLAGTLIWTAGFFDALDGSVARAGGKVTVYGDFLDSVLDRYSDSVIYLGIMVHFLKSGRQDCVFLAAVAIVGSLAVSYVRAKAESLGRKCEIGLLPRTARIVILGLSFCLYQPFWGLLIIAALSNLTALQRIIYVRNNIQD